MEHIITKTCWQCHETFHLTVTCDQWDQWHAGALIQDAFPHLSADDREILISGTCGACFDKMFA